MSKKAEEAARKKYPIYWAKAVMPDGYTIDLDANETTRNVFKLGYEQAEKDLSDIAAFSSGIDGFYYGRGYQQGKKDSEKDLELTWEDIALIDDLLCEVQSMSKKKYYTEVLERFKEAKK